MIFDMLKRLRSVVYLPNDYVCKKVMRCLGVMARLCRALGKARTPHREGIWSKTTLVCSWSCTKTDLFCCSSEQQESRRKLAGVFGMLR